jgi:hypothetical protein
MVCKPRGLGLDELMDQQGRQRQRRQQHRQIAMVLREQQLDSQQMVLVSALMEPPEVLMK